MLQLAPGRQGPVFDPRGAAFASVSAIRLLPLPATIRVYVSISRRFPPGIALDNPFASGHEAGYPLLPDDGEKSTVGGYPVPLLHCVSR